MSTTATENLESIYDAQLKSQKSQLTQNYEQALSGLDASQQAAQKQLDQNLNTTAVEAQRAQKNYNEVQTAYGLSSGARAQARLAQDNQLQADLTTLRAAHQNAEAETERQRTLLGQQYAAAIAQAQAENDMQKAQALYAEAKQKEAELTARKESAAALMAQAGDFSLYGQLYGLTPEQIGRLQASVSGGSGVVAKVMDPRLTTNQVEESRKLAINQLVEKIYQEKSDITIHPWTATKVALEQENFYTDEELEYALAALDYYFPQ